MTKSSTKGKTNPIIQNNTDLLVYGAVFLAWYVYLFLILQNPVNADYDLSKNMIMGLRMTIAIPYLIIWLMAAYAYIRIVTYSRVIRPSQESRAFGYLGCGVLSLLLGLIIPTLLTTISSHLGLTGTVKDLFTVATNYARVIPYLLAFILFYRCVHVLNWEQNISIRAKKLAFFLAPLVLLAYFWLEIIFNNPDRSSSVYFLKDSMIILTVVIPVLTTWVLGVAAAVRLHTYATRVEGLIYARAVKLLTVGLAVVVVGSILLQSLVSLGGEILTSLSLKQLLAVIYAFLLIQGTGYLFLARGAKKLTRIEAV